MRRGINVSGLGGFPVPADLPAGVEVARFQPNEPPPFQYVNAPFVKALKEAGMDGLARCPWRRPPYWDAAEWDDARWLKAWAENVDVELHEYGNEPPPEFFKVYRSHLLTGSPILRASGRKVVLAAARTKYTGKWLSTTPDAVYEAVDAVAVHPYSESPREVLARVAQARQYVPDHLPMVVSEIGISVNDRGIKGEFPVIDPTGKTVPEIEYEQAHFIRHTFRLLDEHAATLNLILTVCFCHLTPPLTVLERWAECGTVRVDGTERPAFGALAP